VAASTLGTVALALAGWALQGQPIAATHRLPARRIKIITVFVLVFVLIRPVYGSWVSNLNKIFFPKK
jgi:hypothetical protein